MCIVQKQLYILFIGISAALSAHAQEYHPYFRVNQDEQSRRVNFSLTTRSGHCHVIPNDNSDEPVLIMGQAENRAATSSFWTELEGDTKHVKVELRNPNEGSALSKMISNTLSSKPTEQHNWRVYLSKHHKLNLDFNYLFGSAFLNLSHLEIENLKVNTASADVHLGFNDKVYNKTQMDTFLVKVEFGSIVIKDLHLANVKEVIANVGFGSMKIDFEHNWNNASNIQASVAAGSLSIFLPKEEVPIKIQISDSPLCSIRMIPGLKQLEKNIFVNQAFLNQKENPIHFHLDVGMGSISFHQK